MSYITEQRARYNKEQESEHKEEAGELLTNKREVTWTPASQKYESENKKIKE